jgi:hypothetical protein
VFKFRLQTPPFLKSLTILTSFLLLCFTGSSQVVRQPLSIRYAGLGAYSKNFVDVFSGASNQAALAQLKAGGFGVYGERKFLLEELNQFSSVIAVPTSSGTFAVQGDYFGFNSFNENQLGIAYARSIAKQVDVGVKFNYHTIRMAGYGSASTVNFEAGTIFHLTEKLHTGFHVYNPLGSKFSKNTNEKLASIYKAGVGYEPSDKFFISTEIIKQEDQPVNVNVGMQYNLQQTVFFRGGISTLTNNTYLGVGLLLGIARVDLNAAYHPQLGFTPGILLLFNFKKPVQD